MTPRPALIAIIALVSLINLKHSYANGLEIPEPAGGWSYPTYSGSGSTYDMWFETANQSILEQGISFGDDIHITPTIDGLTFIARESNQPYQGSGFEFHGTGIGIHRPGGGFVWLSAGSTPYDLNLYVNESISTGYLSLEGFGYPAPYLGLGDGGINFGDGQIVQDTLLSRAGPGVLAINGQRILTTSGTNATTRLRIGGNTTPSAAWKATAIIGDDTQNKIITGYLASNTNGAVIGAHNSALSGWADLNIAGSNLIFRSNETERMRITNGGNVGIGTSSPATNLEIYGNSPIVTIRQNPGTPGGGTLDITAAGSGSDSNAATLKLHTGGAIWARTDSAGLRFGNHSKTATWLTVNATGDLGVGTTAPTTKLDVAGNVRSTGGYIFQGAGGPTSIIPMKFLNWYGQEALSIKFENLNNPADIELKFKDSLSNLQELTYDRHGVTLDKTTATFKVIAQTNPTTNIMSISRSGAATSDFTVSNSGNVGIGTTTPSAKLEVNGTVQITGNVTVKNAAVIRISPTGDIGMGNFTSGTNPQL